MFATKAFAMWRLFQFGWGGFEFLPGQWTSWSRLCWSISVADQGCPKRRNFINYIHLPFGKQAVGYWKWPSRNSWFTWIYPLIMMIFHTSSYVTVSHKKCIGYGYCKFLFLIVFPRTGSGKTHTIFGPPGVLTEHEYNQGGEGPQGRGEAAKMSLLLDHVGPCWI